MQPTLIARRFLAINGLLVDRIEAEIPMTLDRDHLPSTACVTHATFLISAVHNGPSVDDHDHIAAIEDVTTSASFSIGT